MINKIKIAVFGCRHNTRDFIETLIKHGIEISLLVTIDNNAAEKNQVSGYSDMSSMSEIKNIYVTNNYNLSDLNTSDLNLFTDFDIGLCIGWQRIIPKNILDKFSQGVFGMHATQFHLPYGKGRSPINWGIIHNAKSLYANIFKYDEYVDNGLIFSSKQIHLNLLDDINTTQQKLSLVFCDEVINLINSFKNNNVMLKKQDGDKGEYFYPKRTEDDGKINFNDNMNNIVNFVRAQTKPYPGAYILTSHNRYKVWKIIPCELYLENIVNKPKNGQIIKHFLDGNIVISCNNGYVMLTDHDVPSKLSKDEVIII